MTTTCHYCKNEAIVLCDRVLNRPLSVCLQDGGDKIKTCDRPICDEHRKKVGHFCDRSRRTTNNHSDTIDHCWEHAR